MATKSKPKSKSRTASAKSTPKPKSKSSAPKSAPAVNRKTVPTTSRKTSSSGFQLTPPKQTTFWAAVILGAIGLIAQILHLSKLLSFNWLSPFAFWVTVVAFVVLVLGLFIKRF
jgi:hypothetical protein